jgi:hypothetical protein
MTSMKRTSTSLVFLQLLTLAGALVSGHAHASEESPAVLTAAENAVAQEPAPREPVRFAVVIGNNKSLGARRPDLHYADDDAARYSEILETLAPGRVSLLATFDRDTRKLFPDAHNRTAAPRVSVLQGLGQQLKQQVQAVNRAGHETELYFVFAGHGDVAEGEGYIELADARFRSSELQSWLRGIPFTRAHVILDSCNSFFMLGVRKPGGRHFATSEDAARSLASQLPNVGVFLSTSAEGEAFEWSEIQSGIFSHLVRSGLMGAADANADGSVSYVELAAFVDTATNEMRNPNMRPHVFARGPGSLDETPIAELRSMKNVRRFELSDAQPLRVRLRDADGVPLFDAHAEDALSLQIAMPEAWARGAVVERRRSLARSRDDAGLSSLYAIPEPPGVVTLAALQALSPRSAGRGPDETFQTLFTEPFGPRAFSNFLTRRNSAPPPVYGISKEDLIRMQLVLDEIARAERGRRLTESVGGIGFGALLVGGGIGVLHIDPNLSRREKNEARWLGGGLLGLGGLFVIGGAGALAATSKGEAAASEFRRAIRAGEDPRQAFVAADASVQDRISAEQQMRWAGAIVGSALILGSVTGFVWGEIAHRDSDSHMARRLAWGGGMLGGGLMLGEALLSATPAQTLTRIWRDDPSLNQYQLAPSVTLSGEGALVGLSGQW